MKHKKQTGKKTVAILLFAILIFPSALNFFHHCCEHEQIEYSKNKSQIKQPLSNCDVCDLNLPLLNHNISNYNDLKPTEIAVEVNIVFDNPNLQAVAITNTQLRAPPFFS